jgi:methylphosphotriester-DNA--protein-cysteine methyltransferase
MADTRLAAAMRHLHGDPARAWTVVELAQKAALSRSAFFERFSRAVGLPPMEYLLAWRMAMAKDLLQAQRPRAGRGGRTRGLQLGQHFQHRVQPPCGAGAWAVCAAATAAFA